MSVKEITSKAADSLKMVYNLRKYVGNKKGELADIVNGAADEIEELTAIIFQLTGERENEREKTNSVVSDK